MFVQIARKMPALMATAASVVLLTFLLMHLAPGDPLDAYLGQEGASATEKALIRANFGLDKPLYVRMADYGRKLAAGNLGEIPGKGAVSAIIARRFVATARLAFVAILISICVGVTAGLATGWFADTPFDRLTQVALIFSISAPIFWVGLVALLIFAWVLNLLPAAGSATLAHLILPATTLGLRPAAMVARVTRANCIEVKSQTFILAARARGVSQTSLIFKHVLKLVSIPIVTIVGMDLASLLSGAVITETVFSYQGLGQFAVEAITNRWYDAVMAVTLLWVCLFVAANFVVDMSYAALDPRIRETP